MLRRDAGDLREPLAEAVPRDLDEDVLGDPLQPRRLHPLADREVLVGIVGVRGQERLDPGLHERLVRRADLLVFGPELHGDFEPLLVLLLEAVRAGVPRRGEPVLGPLRVLRVGVRQLVALQDLPRALLRAVGLGRLLSAAVVPEHHDESDHEHDEGRGAAEEDRLLGRLLPGGPAGGGGGGDATGGGLSGRACGARRRDREQLLALVAPDPRPGRVGRGVERGAAGAGHLTHPDSPRRSPEPTRQCAGAASVLVCAKSPKITPDAAFVRTVVLSARGVRVGWPGRASVRDPDPSAGVARIPEANGVRAVHSPQSHGGHGGRRRCSDGDGQRSGRRVEPGHLDLDHTSVPPLLCGERDVRADGIERPPCDRRKRGRGLQRQ